MAKQINIETGRNYFDTVQKQFVMGLSSTEPVFGTNMVFYRADALMKLQVKANGYVIGEMYVQWGYKEDSGDKVSKENLKVVFRDVFSNTHDLIIEDGGKIETSDVELAQKIQNIYIDFAERMFK